MKLIDKINNTINYGKSIEEQIDELSLFKNLSEDEILDLTTHLKSATVGILIEYLGFEKLRNHLPSFLIFLQDANWPAAVGAAKMLGKAREIIIPEIKRVFQEVRNDPIWHYWILILIIQDWDAKLVSTIKSELIELVNRADYQCASIQALSILKQKELITEIEVEYYYQYLLKKFEVDEYCRNELIQEINAS